VSFIIGQDLGQAVDYSARAFIERTQALTQLDDRRGEYFEDRYVIRKLERPAKKTKYTDQVTDLSAQLKSEVIKDADLVVDATGVGRPVIDIMRHIGLSPIPVLITGGSDVNQSDGFWRVPKKILVSTLAIVLQSGRLQIVSGLALRDVLQREMMAFKVKVHKNAHETYDAQEGEHDDIVIAVALAVWWGERTAKGGWRLNPAGEEFAKQARLKAYREKRDRPYWKR
jgi:hypothetical protein